MTSVNISTPKRYSAIDSPDWRSWRDHYDNIYYWTLNKPDGKKYCGKIWSAKKRNIVKKMMYSQKSMVKKYLLKEIRNKIQDIIEQKTKEWIGIMQRNKRQ